MAAVLVVVFAPPGWAASTGASRNVRVTLVSEQLVSSQAGRSGSGAGPETAVTQPYGWSVKY